MPLAVKTRVDACPALLDFGSGSQRTQKSHQTVSGIISDDAQNSRGPRVGEKWVVFEGSPVFVIACFGSDSEPRDLNSRAARVPAPPAGPTPRAKLAVMSDQMETPSALS